MVMMAEIVYIYYIYRFILYIHSKLCFLYGFLQEKHNNPMVYPRCVSILHCQADGGTLGWKSSSKFTYASHLLKPLIPVVRITSIYKP